MGEEVNVIQWGDLISGREGDVMQWEVIQWERWV